MERAEGADVTGGSGGRRLSPPDGGYPHDALLFDTRDQLVDVAVPFLLAGLDADEGAVIATSRPTAELLCEAIDGDPRVDVLRRDEVYDRRTATAITTYRRVGEQRIRAGVRRVRVVGEIDYGPTPRDWLEWQRYEAVVNRALGGCPLWGLCLFDTRRVPEPILESAMRTHQHLHTPGGRVPNPDFMDPADYVRALPVPPEPLENSTPRLSADDVADFIGLRHAVAAELATSTASRETAEDFLLAIDEMTSNAVRHGEPPVSLRLWMADDRIVCTIADRGPGCDDPFAGYGPAHGDDLSRGGMGLWLARQLCDHVDLTQGADGTAVRLTIRLR
jgi:anti-sigma regulatory factor (Ser/Thr protein kinase)